MEERSVVGNRTTDISGEVAEGSEVKFTVERDELVLAGASTETIRPGAGSIACDTSIVRTPRE